MEEKASGEWAKYGGLNLFATTYSVLRRIRQSSPKGKKGQTPPARRFQGFRGSASTPLEVNVGGSLRVQGASSRRQRSKPFLVEGLRPPESRLSPRMPSNVSEDERW